MARSSVPERTPTTTRESRGIRLFEQQGDDIQHLDGWRWRVPSCSGEAVYVADLRHQSCTCPDHRRHGVACKHLTAATIARTKSSECGGCGRRVRRRELHPVPEDHPTLGGLVDELCRGCGRSQGVV